MTKEFKQRIDAIPPNGEWWKKSTRETFMQAATMMTENGISEDAAIETLEELFGAVADEFGN